MRGDADHSSGASRALQGRDQMRQRVVAGDPSKPFLRLQQRIREPATCLVRVRPKTCHATQLATRVQERILNRVGAQQRTM